MLPGQRPEQLERDQGGWQEVEPCEALDQENGSILVTISKLYQEMGGAHLGSSGNLGPGWRWDESLSEGR